jgi:hypothetical protein
MIWSFVNLVSTYSAPSAISVFRNQEQSVGITISAVNTYSAPSAISVFRKQEQLEEKENLSS